MFFTQNSVISIAVISVGTLYYKVLFIGNVASGSLHFDMEEHKKSFLDKLSYVLLGAIVFLLPVFFLPLKSLNVEVGKAALVSVGVFAAALVWLVARLIDGKFSVPKSSILWAEVGIAITFFISAILSPTRLLSIFGQGFEVGTAGFFLGLLLLSFLSATIFASRERVLRFVKIFLASAGIVAAFQVVRLLLSFTTNGYTKLSFGIFNDSVSNLVGRWHELGIFNGLVVIVLLAMLETLSLRAVLKQWVYILLAVSFFFVALTNYTAVYLAVFLFSLVLFLYSGYFARHQGENPPRSRYKRITASLVVAVLSLVLFSVNAMNYAQDCSANPKKDCNNPISRKLEKMFAINKLEVSPTFSATYNLAKVSLKQNPWFGAGPNRFTNVWLANKPTEVNLSNFWGVDFSSGSGLIPTFAITTGLVGLFAWLMLILLFIRSGLKAVFRLMHDRVAQFTALMSFLASLYLMVFLFIYVPGVALYALTFIFIGIFMAVLSYEGVIKTRQFSLMETAGLGFVSIFGIVVSVLLVAYALYSFGTRTLSILYFQKANLALSDGSLDQAKRLEKADALMQRSISLYDSQVYYRQYAELTLAKLQQLFSNTSLSKDQLTAQFQQIFKQGMAGMDAAIGQDKNDYNNWIETGRLFESVAPLGYTGAYDNAERAYTQALTLNPSNPSIYLMLARMEASRNNLTKVREYVNKALALKPNYSEGIFLLSQLEVTQGNIDEAIKRVTELAVLNPNDPSVFFQLGLLYYNQKDYQKTALAMNQAVVLSPNQQFANAQYFRGLALYRLGQVSLAISDFESIQSSNPDNKDVATILANLKAGRDPLTQVPPPGNKPEKATKLPVKEKTAQ